MVDKPVRDRWSSGKEQNSHAELMLRTTVRQHSKESSNTHCSCGCPWKRHTATSKSFPWQGVGSCWPTAVQPFIDPRRRPRGRLYNAPIQCRDRLRTSMNVISGSAGDWSELDNTSRKLAAFEVLGLVLGFWFLTSEATRRRRVDLVQMVL